MAIDLSTVKALEVPTKEISVKVGEKVQKLTIHPFKGRGRVALHEFNIEFAGAGEQLETLALVYGADMSGIQAKFLLDNAPETALEISQAVWEFNHEYSAKVKAEREEAKKKSGTAVTETNTLN